MTKQPTILVTGGASGIGFAIVEAVLAAGWRAIAVDVDAGHLASARKTLGERAELRFEQLDVADDDAVVKSIAACEREFGPLSGVVNSAGIARDVATLETNAALFRRILDVNLVGSFLVSREAAKAMVGRGGGAIVNLASISGVTGNKGRTAYGAPTDIASAAMFLLDDQKSGFITGQTICVDGGFTIAGVMRSAPPTQ